MMYYEVLHFDDPVKPVGSTKAQTLLEASQVTFHSAIDYVVAVEDGKIRALTEEEEDELRRLRPGSSRLGMWRVFACPNTPCPKCGHEITPAEIKRVSWSEIECPKCGERFSAAKR